MWDEFYKDIDGQEFSTREDYEDWVRGWVEDTINECGRIERWALGLADETATDELSIKIGEQNG